MKWHRPSTALLGFQESQQLAAPAITAPLSPADGRKGNEQQRSWSSRAHTGASGRWAQNQSPTKKSQVTPLGAPGLLLAPRELQWGSFGPAAGDVPPGLEHTALAVPARAARCREQRGTALGLLRSERFLN